jgi:heterodisulfide reductase subunit A-like polyferredoxin
MVCPHAVFEIKAQKAFMTDKDACMECGACQLNCPVEAISVNAGVGCAEAIIRGALKGTEASCDCSCESSDICC